MSGDFIGSALVFPCCFLVGVSKLGNLPSFSLSVLAALESCQLHWSSTDGNAYSQSDCFNSTSEIGWSQGGQDFPRGVSASSLSTGASEWSDTGRGKDKPRSVLNAPRPLAVRSCVVSTSTSTGRSAFIFDLSFSEQALSSTEAGKSTQSASRLRRMASALGRSIRDELKHASMVRRVDKGNAL